MLNYLICAEDANNGGGSWSFLLIFGVLIILMVVMTVLPQRKKQKQYDQMMSELKVGCSIRTLGGIVGTIVEMQDDGTIILMTGSKNKPTYLKMDRYAISNIIEKNIKEEILPKSETKSSKSRKSAKVTDNIATDTAESGDTEDQTPVADSVDNDQDKIAE